MIGRNITAFKLALGAFAAAAASGAGFAGWFNNGDAMLVSLYEAGIAWCF